MVRSGALDRAEKRRGAPRFDAAEIPRLGIVAAFPVARGACDRAAGVGVENRMPRVLAADVGERNRRQKDVGLACGTMRHHVECRRLAALEEDRSFWWNLGCNQLPVDYGGPPAGTRRPIRQGSVR